MLAAALYIQRFRKCFMSVMLLVQDDSLRDAEGAQHPNSAVLGTCGGNAEVLWHQNQCPKPDNLQLAEPEQSRKAALHETHGHSTVGCTAFADSGGRPPLLKTQDQASEPDLLMRSLEHEDRAKTWTPHCPAGVLPADVTDSSSKPVDSLGVLPGMQPAAGQVLVSHGAISSPAGRVDVQGKSTPQTPALPRRGLKKRKREGEEEQEELGANCCKQRCRTTERWFTCCHDMVKTMFRCLLIIWLLWDMARDEP